MPVGMCVESYGGVGRVHRLAAGTARPVDVDADVLLRDVDLVGLLEHRHHLDGGEAGLPAALVVERADPHQAVGARLDAERPVGVGRVHGERRRLQAGLLGVGGVEDLDGVLVALGPPGVHPHQHLGEVGGVHAAGAGADRDDRLAGVVLPGEEGADLELVHQLVQLLQLGLVLGGGFLVALLGGHLDHQAEVLEAALQLVVAVQVGLQRREASGHPLCVGLVVPQVRHRDLLAEVGDLPAHVVEVQDGTDGLHRRLELLDLGVEVGGCHKDRGYAAG